MKNYCLLITSGILSFFSFVSVANAKLPISDASFQVPPVSNVFVTPSPFLKDLLSTFEFIGFSDILVAMAVGNSEPWTRYDDPGSIPFLKLWRETIALNLSTVDSRLQLVVLHEALSKNSEHYRDHPVVGGGDEMIDGPKVQGYYQVDSDAKLALESNPYLTLTLRPGPLQSDGTPSHYIKHEYPSARTFHRFESLIESGLLTELRLAEAQGALKDPSSVEFKDLTRRLIGQLAGDVLSDTQGKTSERYQKLMSIHPFGDFNGRTLRVWYRRTTGKPLFLPNWDWDLFMTPQEFAHAAEIGDNQLEWMRRSFLAEQALHPQFPDYYRAPGTWQVAAGVDNEAAHSATEIRDLLRAVFNELGVKQAVQHKQDGPVRERILEVIGAH